ncbi:MAG: T9SS type A sorting domain-containing protein [Bacteroidales bacterium]|nr:T9SS type A sorting domain-containing protein [Bacteroidales bacterium]
MTAEELAAYNAAQDAYTAQCEAYFDWMEMVYELEEAIPQFSSNNQCLSAQGQFLAAQAIKLDWNTGLYECGLYLFDIEANTFDTFTFYNIDYLSTFVNDEGYMLASSPINYIDMPANAYIRKPGSKTFQLLQDYVNERNPEAYKWMEQKMSHEYYIYDEKGREVGTEGLNTGLACASADLSLIGMCMENYWDQGASENEFSYIVDMNNTEAGISAVEVDPAEIEVYDLNGRRMPSNIDLVPGIYIVKQGNTVRKIRY